MNMEINDQELLRLMENNILPDGKELEEKLKSLAFLTILNDIKNGDDLAKILFVSKFYPKTYEEVKQDLSIKIFE